MFSHVQEIYSEEKNTFFFFLRTALVRRCILYCEKSLSVLGAQFSDQVNDGRREEEDGQRRRGGESGGGVAQVSFAGSAEGHLVPRNFGHRLTRVGFGVFRHGARTNRRHLAAVLVCKTENHHRKDYGNGGVKTRKQETVLRSYPCKSSYNQFYVEIWRENMIQNNYFFYLLSNFVFGLHKFGIIPLHIFFYYWGGYLQN